MDDINTLLMPVSAESPCGDNLEYDTDFMSIIQIAAGKPEQQFGDTIIPAEAPDWLLVERKALSLLMRTKDLRLMVYLTKAWTQMQGLVGYANGVTLILRALEMYWEPLYPQLYDEGEFDPLYRINALSELSDQAELTQMLRAARLYQNGSDEILFRDACALLDGTKQNCPTFPGGKTRLLDELKHSEQPAIHAVATIEEKLIRIRETITQHLGEQGLPSMEHLLKTLGMIAQVRQQPASSVEEEDLRPHNADGQQSITDPLMALALSEPQYWRSAQIQSRDDAVLMLDKVKLYFRTHEPSHPAPMMIERVQRLIALDFMQIVSDLAPQGLSQLETILGISTDNK